MHEQIEPGFMVFLADGEDGIGAVREVRRSPAELLIYIENAGEFVVPTSAVAAVHSGKVILDSTRVGMRVRDALAGARDSEDPSYTAPGNDADE
jgi:hypothetical protein